MEADRECSENQGKEDRASQLGKSYKDDQVFLKNPEVYLAYFHKGSKKKSPKFSNYEDLIRWKKKTKIVTCRLTMTSFLAQLFDFSGRHLSLVRAYCKEALRLHLAQGSSGWETAASEEAETLFNRSLLAYFLVCHQGLPRSHLYLNPATGYLLIGGSDGALHLHANTVTLVSFLRLNGKYSAKAQHLSLNTYVNHILLNQQMHYVELLSCFKLVLNLLGHKSDLQHLGLDIPPHHVLFLTDSRYVLLTVRSLPMYYCKKICALVTRLQQALSQNELSPWTNFAFIRQFDLPPTPLSGNPTCSEKQQSNQSGVKQPKQSKQSKQRFHADILSKTRGEAASESSLLEDFQALHCLSWLESDPKSWKFVERASILPALSDQTLLELGANPDNLRQFQEFLKKKPQVIACLSSLGWSTETWKDQRDEDENHDDDDDDDDDDDYDDDDDDEEDEDEDDDDRFIA